MNTPHQRGPGNQKPGDKKGGFQGGFRRPVPVLVRTGQLLQGIVRTTGAGVGYLQHEDFEQDIEVPQGLLNTALSGDTVEVALATLVPGERQLGEVTKILERAKTQFVGTLEEGRGDFYFMVADDRRMYTDLFIPKHNAKGAGNGDKVLAKIVGWSDGKKNPEGEVIKVLGKKGQHEVEMQAIILERGIDTDFSKEVEDEAHELQIHEKTISPEEVAKRRDFRGIPTFTIDPLDAKDFDDALSVKTLENGNIEVGIHIADVSHYVREGSALDREALKRSFSVYLVDRTIPMLPEALSNDLCSLNPEEDKLTYSAVFELDANAEIRNRWFGRTVIHSVKRFTYEEAQEVLDKKDGPYLVELETLNRLAKKLMETKFKNGAIAFEEDEVKFRLDPNGKPVEVYRKVRGDTHKLVEDFMLLANKEVAEFLFEQAKKRSGASPGMYRIHDVPQREKIEELSVFLRAMGYDLGQEGKELSSKDINKLLEEIAGKPEEGLIRTATIRSMAKAIYSTKNIGHFGLAFKYYTHFTSPIRRYPDLLVHRLVEKELHGEKTGPVEVAFYERAAVIASEQEMKATSAERESIRYKQVEYMSERIGTTYQGIISGVTEWGIYVEEVETKCEGMVKLRSLSDDFYTLDRKNYRLVGEKTKRVFSLGDRVTFKVAGADIDRKLLDFALVA